MEESMEESAFVCDLSAYELFHEGFIGAPCLSFDILRDGLGENRDCDTPLTCYFVSGSQTTETQKNNVAVFKLSNLGRVKLDDSDDEDSDEKDDDDDENEIDEKERPVISSAVTSHKGGVNRIRATTVNDIKLAASWSELGHVNIWNLTSMLEAVEKDEKEVTKFEESPLFSYKKHKAEGFAIDWSPTMAGTLASGDCSRAIHVLKPEEGGKWSGSDKPYSGHTASVEDIQWSPNEENVFASCSVDKSIRIWDCRANPSTACMLACENAHSKDVNVINWNRNDPFIASGGDDGEILIWDLRKFETKTPVARLKYHSGPVTSVEWHPKDSSVFASAGEDDKLLQWDLAVEKDSSSKQENQDTPQQLLFIHQGQSELKELHWHPQIPGVIFSTANSGFNIFKTISC